MAAQSATSLLWLYNREEYLRVPYGHLHAPTVYTDGLTNKIDADGTLQRLEAVAGEAVEERRLANQTISYEKNLELMIVAVRHHASPASAQRFKEDSSSGFVQPKSCDERRGSENVDRLQYLGIGTFPPLNNMRKTQAGQMSSCRLCRFREFL